MNNNTKLYYVVVGWGYNSQEIIFETDSLKAAEKERDDHNGELDEDEYDDSELRAYVLIENDEGVLVEQGFYW